MTTKKWRKLSKWMLYIAFVMVIVGICLAEQLGDVGVKGILILFFALALGSIGISFLFWRCPHCDKGFPIQHTRFDKMEICPFCGKEIE